MNREELLKTIFDGFLNLVYPGDENIVSNNSEEHLECAEIKKLLKGRKWNEIPFEIMDKLHSSIFFLSNEGYRYYLPAFMFFSISDYSRANVITDEIILTLTLPEENDIQKISDTITAAIGTMPNMSIMSSDDWEEVNQQLKRLYVDDSLARRFFNRISGFNFDQQKIIRLFLEYIKKNFESDYPDHAPEIALERYWNKL
jgi:hypothetical protein